MPFTKTWNEASPAGADDVAQGDDAIRDFKYAVRERLAVDHYFLDSEAGDAKIGFHKMLTLIDQSTPAAVADAIRLYSKVVSSESELHVIDEDSNEYQLTLNQRLWMSALRIALQAAGDMMYFNGTIWTRLAKGSAGLDQLRMNAGNTAPEWFTPSAAGAYVIPGTIIPWGGSATPPSGYLLCDGSAVSRTTYADLFTAIGTTHGVGNGTTTFNLPDLQDRFPFGAAGGTANPGDVGPATNTLGGDSAIYGSGSDMYVKSQYESGPTSGPSGPTSPYSGVDGHSYMPPYCSVPFMIKT
jgi:hypothetical protein